MRYRAMSPAGDWTFGQSVPFLTDSPSAVAQAVLTRLRLLSGEWFLDNQEGTDYANGVLGAHTSTTRDQVIRERILSTTGVLELVDYTSDVKARVFTVSATVSTQYGPISVQTTI